VSNLAESSEAHRQTSSSQLAGHAADRAIMATGQQGGSEVALLIRGKSTCHLCGEVITADDRVEMFPSGLFSRGSAEDHLNDSSVHAACLSARPEAAAVARDAVKEYLERLS
jgi:hypothetical protein